MYKELLGRRYWEELRNSGVPAASYMLRDNEVPSDPLASQDPPDFHQSSSMLAAAPILFNILHHRLSNHSFQSSPLYKTMLCSRSFFRFKCLCFKDLILPRAFSHISNCSNSNVTRKFRTLSRLTLQYPQKVIHVI